MDPGSITAVLGSIKTALDIAKHVKDSGSSLEKAELKLKLAELMSALADAKVEITLVQQALGEKEDRIRALEGEAEVARKIEYRDPSYWLPTTDGTTDGPYCQHCYDSARKLLRLQDESDGAWECRACKNSYVEPGRRARDVANRTKPIAYPRGSY